MQSASDTDAGVTESGIDQWRKRAAQLNYHYSDLYRAAFLLNYGLAVVAVCLAALSLVLLGKQHAPVVGHAGEIVATAGHSL